MMKKLSTFYAALEQNPVTISYPDYQPAANSKAANKWKRNDAFLTYYDFGEYRLEHGEFEKNGLEYLHFEVEDSGESYATVFVKKDGRPGITPKDEPWLNLAEQIKNKAAGKTYKNIFFDKINDATYDLMWYVRDALPDGSMSADESEKLYNQLDKIRTRLMATQTIKQKVK